MVKRTSPGFYGTAHTLGLGKAAKAYQATDLASTLSISFFGYLPDYGGPFKDELMFF
jgi:hypothetical protein